MQAKLVSRHTAKVFTYFFITDKLIGDLMQAGAYTLNINPNRMLVTDDDCGIFARMRY